MTQHRTYIGPHDAVELAATGQVVRRGAQVEVDDDLAAALDEQPGNWAKTNAKAARDVTPAPPAVVEKDVTFDGHDIEPPVEREPTVDPTQATRTAPETAPIDTTEVQP